MPLKKKLYEFLPLLLGLGHGLRGGIERAFSSTGYECKQTKPAKNGFAVHEVDPFRA
jgi:hypothetical protein